MCHVSLAASCIVTVCMTYLELGQTDINALPAKFPWQNFVEVESLVIFKSSYTWVLGNFYVSVSNSLIDDWLWALSPEGFPGFLKSWLAADFCAVNNVLIGFSAVYTSSLFSDCLIGWYSSHTSAYNGNIHTCFWSFCFPFFF